MVTVQGEAAAWYYPPGSFNPEAKQLAHQIRRKFDLNTKIAGAKRKFAQDAPTGNNAQFLPAERLAPIRHRALDN